MNRYYFIVISLFFSSYSFSKTQMAAHVEVVYGQAWASEQLSGKLDTGKVYRLKLFGGAKLPKIKFLNAVGLGLDFSFSDFKDKVKTTNFKYQTFSWDWIHIPVNIGVIRLVPGLSWVVTAVNDPSLGVSEKSIRQQYLLLLGIFCK